MTSVYITVDTEYSSSMYAREGMGCRQANFDRSIRGATTAGDAGIFYQMDVLERHGLKAIFFVDPMPALVWGTQPIADIVGPVIQRGHDVQLHLHTEWLEHAGADNPVGAKTGRNIKDFSLADQKILIDYAIGQLVAAGAPRPIAFRAGNYGANDDTLRALASLNIQYETSHCPGIAASQCAISLGPDDRIPVMHCGVMEVPIGSIGAAGGAQRHVQITALSAQELCAAIRHANAHNFDSFTLVSHSFELLSRDRTRINHIVKRRFEKLCAAIADMPGISTATYAQRGPNLVPRYHAAPLLPHNFFRTGWRMREQALGNILYGG